MIEDSPRCDREHPPHREEASCSPISDSLGNAAAIFRDTDTVISFETNHLRDSVIHIISCVTRYPTHASAIKKLARSFIGRVLLSYHHYCHDRLTAADCLKRIPFSCLFFRPYQTYEPTSWRPDRHVLCTTTPRSDQYQSSCHGLANIHERQGLL